MLKRKIAVVGSGIAGLACAWKLAPHAEVFVFEQASRPGGHIHTHEVQDIDGRELKIDTGFIMFNRIQYPRFCALLNELGVSTAESKMSFAFPGARPGSTFSSAALNQFQGLFAVKLEEELAVFHSMIDDYSEHLMPLTLKEFLAHGDFSETFVDSFLIPLVKGLFSMNSAQAMQIPMQRVFQFLRVHGLHDLQPKSPWLFVPGGYQDYVQKILMHENIDLRLNSKVESVSSDSLLVCGGEEHQFDAIVLACEADIALRLLESPSERQQELLSPFEYKLNKGFLHSDESVFSEHESFSGIALHHSNDAGCISLHLNALLQLESRQNFFMTLNPAFEIDPKHQVANLAYRHLVVTPEVLAAQSQLHQLNGEGPIYFAGAYWRYFHEDALKSAQQVADALLP